MPRGKRRLPDQRWERFAAADLIVHDAGAAAGRLRRMRDRFPGCGAMVFGHSHVPLHEADGAFQIFNPGSPTDKRRQPGHTMGEALVRDGAVRFELVQLG